MAIDIMCLAAAAYGFFLGFKEGLVSTFFRFISIFLALMAAFKFSPYVSEVLEKSFALYNPLMFIVGFLLTYFLMMWALRFLGDLVTQGMEIAHVNLPNQVVGGAALAGFFVVIYSLVIWFGDSARMISQTTKLESMSYRFLEPLPQKTFKVLGDLKPTFQKFFQQANRMMDEVGKSRVSDTERKTDIYSVPENNQPPPPPPANNGSTNW
jgi:membrane protein required for colicin V production